MVTTERFLGLLIDRMRPDHHDVEVTNLVIQPAIVLYAPCMNDGLRGGSGMTEGAFTIVMAVLVSSELGGAEREDDDG